MSFNWSNAAAGAAGVVADQAGDILEMRRKERLIQVQDESWMKRYDRKRTDTLDDRVDQRQYDRGLLGDERAYTEGQNELKHRRALESTENQYKMQDKYRKPDYMLTEDPITKNQHVVEKRPGGLGLFDEGVNYSDEGPVQPQPSFTPLRKVEQSRYSATADQTDKKVLQNHLKLLTEQNGGMRPEPGDPLYVEYENASNRLNTLMNMQGTGGGGSGGNGSNFRPSPSMIERMDVGMEMRHRPTNTVWRKNADGTVEKIK